MNIEKLITQYNLSEKPFGFGIGISKWDTHTEYYSQKTYKGIDQKQYNFGSDTLFDIASITKSLVGLVAVKMIEQGEIDLDFKINSIIKSSEPSWEKIDIRSLLTNSLELGINQKLHFLTNDEVSRIISNAPVTQINNGYRYHNTTSIILGWVLEKIYQQPLEEIISKEILRPAGMKNTYFPGDIDGFHLKKVVPTEHCGTRGLVHGMPHDELAYMYAKANKFTGCAGIFSTVPDMILLGKYLWERAFKNPEKMLGIMKKNYLELFGGTFGLAFDKPATSYLCPCFARETLVATGYTGCNIWINPDKQTVVTILSNSTFPNRGDRGKKSPLGDFRKAVAREVFSCKHCFD